jgi:DnaJ-class molecular chaperone
MKCKKCNGTSKMNYGSEESPDIDECYVCQGTGVTQTNGKGSEE